MNYYQVCIEGIDKAGKDVLHPILDQLCNHCLSINVRGLMSNIAYDTIYNRDRNYDLTRYSNVISIYLTVDEDDWKIRCKTTHETDVTLSDYKKHRQVFDNVARTMTDAGLIVWEYNTSDMTPYMIAKDILNRIILLNGEAND